MKKDLKKKVFGDYAVHSLQHKNCMDRLLSKRIMQKKKITTFSFVCEFHEMKSAEIGIP